MDTVIPPPRKIPEGQRPQTTATSGGLHGLRNLGKPGEQAPKQLWNGEGSGVAPMPHKMIDEVEVEDLGPESEDEEPDREDSFGSWRSH